MSSIWISLAVFAMAVAMTMAQTPINPFQGPPGMMTNAAFGYMFSPFGPMAPFNAMHPFSSLNPFAGLTPFSPASPWSQQRLGAANSLGPAQSQSSPNIFSGLSSIANILDMLDLV